MNVNRLLHCSNRSCSALIYLSEAIPGRLIPTSWHPGGEGSHGRYCVACARSLGWWSPDDVITAGDLLRSAGMIDQPMPWYRPKRVAKSRLPKTNPDQMELL